MADCRINYVVAPNGEVSKLFGQLNRITGDQEKALKMYLDAIDTEFPSEDLNEQGEATLSALEDAGFFDSYDLLRFQKGPSSYNKIAIEDDVADEVISQLEGGIDFLEKQLNSGLTEAEQNEIRDQIREFRDDIQNIYGRPEEEKVNGVRNAAERHFDWIDSLDANDEPRMLLLAYRMADKMWNTENTYQFLSPEERANDDNDYKQAFTEIGKEADQRVDKIVNYALDSIVDYVEKEIGRPVTKDELQNLQDIGTLKENLYNISHVDEKITQFIREITINASRKEDSTIQDLQAELSEFEDDIDPEVILREDENGNKVPELISPFSQNYYSKRSEFITKYHNAKENAKEQGPDEYRKSMKRITKQLHENLNDIEILIDPNRLSAEDTKNLTQEEKKYKQELIDKGIDEERVDYALEQAKMSLAEYKKRESEHLDYIKSQIGDGLTQEQLNEVSAEDDVTSQQWRDYQMAKWRRQNSPFLYYEDRVENNTIQYLFNRGYEHTNSLPRPTEENYSDAWNELNDREKEFWHYYTQTINKVSGWLPQEDTRGLDETFLPKVKKNVLEQFEFNGSFYAGKRLVKDLVNSVRNMEESSSLLEESEDEIDTTAFGSPADRDKVPVKFIQHPYHEKKKSLKRKLENDEITKEEYQEGLNKDLSLDPIKALQMFTAMGLNYKNMTDVSAVSELAYAMIEQANTVNEEGELVSRGGPAKLSNKAKEEINHLVYGVTRKQNEGQSSYFDNVTTNPFNSFSSRRRMKELENERDKVEEQFENDEIDRDERDSRLEELEEEYQDIAGKPLVWSKVIDNSLLPYAQLKGMGLNFFAGIRNVAHALAGGLIHAAGGQEFGDRDFINALGIFMKDTANRSGKVSALMSKFSILFETAEVKYGEDRKFDGMDPYIIQNRTEFVGQGTTMIATMLGQKIEDVNGNERSLWEAFDENGNWKTEEFGEGGEWQPGNQIKDINQGDKFVEFRNKVIQLNNSIHGDYAKDSNQRLKKYSLGRLVSMFRTWIPELAAYRWQKTRYDQHLGREVTGIHRDTLRSFRDNGVGQTLKTMLGAFPYANPDTKIDEDQAANIRRTAREMQLMATLAISILALSGSGDDDEDRSAAKKIAINNLIMVKQDIGLWMDPAAQINLAKNPVPAVRTYLDYEKALYKTYNALSDEDYQGENPLWSWSQAMPVVKQMNTVKWTSERVLNE